MAQPRSNWVLVDYIKFWPMNPVWKEAGVQESSSLLLANASKPIWTGCRSDQIWHVYWERINICSQSMRLLWIITCHHCNQWWQLSICNNDRYWDYHGWLILYHRNQYVLHQKSKHEITEDGSDVISASASVVKTQVLRLLWMDHTVVVKTGDYHGWITRHPCNQHIYVCSQNRRLPWMNHTSSLQSAYLCL